MASNIKSKLYTLPDTQAWVLIAARDQTRDQFFVEVAASSLNSVDISVGHEPPSVPDSFTWGHGEGFDFLEAPLGPVYVRATNTDASATIHVLEG